ncbi:MAG: hypothetical protein LBP76_04230 [Treponema sp.]|nr:hypothetical protein [Treponema sp.]
MKFKFIFILFNIIITVFFIFIWLFPLISFGNNFTLVFWKQNWYLGLIIILILAGLNVFYALNHRLFSLLEKEDWPALALYLEERIFGRGRYSPRLVRLLANTYLVLSDSPAVLSLENKIALIKPELLERNALVFGAARILIKDYSGAADFFSSQMKSPAALNTQGRWLQFYRGFSLLLDKRAEDAAPDFTILVSESADALLTGLSAYFLAEIISRALQEQRTRLLAFADLGKGRLRETLKTQDAWNREVSKVQNEIHTAMLTKYLTEAGRWLYG